MKYALNKQRGSTINHPMIKLPGCEAVPISEKEAIMLKGIHNVIIFDSIQEREVEEEFGMYSLICISSPSILRLTVTELVTVSGNVSLQ